MSSILTNQSAITALRTIQGTSSSLARTQDRVSTGMKVVDARDNAAIWSVSSKMHTSMASTRVVGEQLGVAISTVALSRGTGEKVVDMLREAMDKAIMRQGYVANGDTANAAVAASEMSAMGASISTMLSSASFNGTNLLQADAAASSGSSGASAPKQLWAYYEDALLGIYQWQQYTDASGWNTASTNQMGGPGPYGGSTDVRNDFLGGTYAGLFAFDGTSWSVHPGISDWTNSPLGGATIYLNGAFFINGRNGPAGTEVEALDLSATPASGGTAAPADATFVIGADGGTFTVSNANLSINLTGTSSVDDIQAMLTSVQTAVANLGVRQTTLETLRDFSHSYGDSLERAVGAMVDADMTDESARLQALQVKEQLGSQAMAIANQAPNILLQLF